MQIIIVGTVKFTLEILEEFCSLPCEIVGVITGTDTGANSDFVDIVPFCIEKNIPFIRTNDINSSETIEFISSKNTDVIFCLGWSRLIKKPVLESTKIGVIGYHPALLPKNRGRHPLIWALALGLEETGSTFFLMDEGADSGDILSQERISIAYEDTANSLYGKMVAIAKIQIRELVGKLDSTKLNVVTQDSGLANDWRKRSKKDGEIDFRMNAENIYNLVRALSHPYVGAHLVFKEKEYKVWNSKVSDAGVPINVEPGKVVKVINDTITVKCGNGCIELLSVSPELEIKEGDYL